MIINIKLNNFDTLSFKQDIIDAHGHKGKFYDTTNNTYQNLELSKIWDTVQLADGDVVKTVFVSNVSGLDAIDPALKEANKPIRMYEKEANEELINEIKKENDKLNYPIAVCQPGYIQPGEKVLILM